jgi:hypothetical protein
MEQECILSYGRKKYAEYLPTGRSKTKLHGRTIPTERLPLVGEVIANILRIEGATWSA